MRKIACVGRVVGTQVPRYLGTQVGVSARSTWLHYHWRKPQRTDHVPYVSLPNLSSLLPCLSTINHYSAPLHQHHHHLHHEQHPDILILHCTFSSTVSASLSRAHCHATDCSNRGLRLWFSGAGLWGATWSTASARAWRTSLCAAETLRRIRRASVAVAVAVH